MGEIANIVDQAKRAYEGGAWHGPALKELLADVKADQAARRPLPGAHSIWEIALHIAAWQRVVSERAKGNRVDEPHEGDWQKIEDLSLQAWQSALAKLDRVQQELVEQISRLDEADLQKPAAGTDYTVYYMLHGVIQHTLYHAGQIALLKKADAS